MQGHAPWLAKLLRPELGELRAYVPAKHAREAVRLDANECPWAFGDAGARELLEALSRVALNRYPDPRATSLREKLAEHTGAHPDELVIGNGSDEVIAMVLGALSKPRPRREKPAVLFAEPSFVMYRMAAMVAGHAPESVALDDDWDLSVEPWREAIEKTAPHVVFLATPNNPTANDLSRSAIEAIVDVARESLVVIDEAYGAFSERDHRDLREQNANVATMGTLSKIGLAGARVGWIALKRELAVEVDKVRQPYNLNALSQAVAELALGPLSGIITEACKRVVSEREVLAETLKTIDGVRVDRSAANFLWIETPRGALDLYEALAVRGVIVRCFRTGGPRLARRLRVTVGARDENQRFVDALRAEL